MTSLFEDILEWTTIMMPLLNFGNSADFERKLEIKRHLPELRADRPVFGFLLILTLAAKVAFGWPLGIILFPEWPLSN